MSVPDRSEFRAPDEVLVEVDPGQKPDGFGRVRFTAFWLAETAPSGVRGQVFRANPAEFVARERVPVRLVSPAGPRDDTPVSQPGRPGLTA